MILSVVPLMVMPAPSAVLLVGLATLAITIFLSSISTVDVLIVVVVPSTVRFPPTTKLPPRLTVLVAIDGYKFTVRSLEFITIASSCVSDRLTLKIIFLLLAEFATFTLPLSIKNFPVLPVPIKIPSSTVISNCPLMVLEVSVLTYVVAAAPPKLSLLVQVARILKLDRVPTLNPGCMLPLNPTISILGVKLSLENIPNNMPLLYRLVTTLV